MRRLLASSVLAVAVLALGAGPAWAGDARYLGSAAGQPLNARVVGVAATRTGQGYWLVGRDGGVWAFGDATFHGSTGATPLNQPIAGMAPTPTGHGYWLVAADGGIFAFGDATFHGSTGATPLNQPIAGMAPTPTGHGYWLVAADGGIFAFGDATFHGSTGATPLNQPIVGMAPPPTGHGYWLVAADGGIFAFGDAAFHGSTGATPLNQPIVGMAATPTGHGYWLVAADGGIFAFGDAAFHGSTGDTALNQPVVGMAATPTGGGYWLATGDGGVLAPEVGGSWRATPSAGGTGSVGPSNPAALVRSGPLTITTPGAVVEDVDVAGPIYVRASNVTIRNFRATNVVQEGGGGMVLEDGEIHGNNDPDFRADGIVWADYTLRRVNVHHVHDGLKGHGDVLVEDSWIHDLNRFTGAGSGAGGYSHNDCLQVSSGSNITVRRSRLERCGYNGAIFVDPDQGPINNVLVEDSYLQGSNFSFWAIPSANNVPWGPPTGVVVRRTVFGGATPGQAYFGNAWINSPGYVWHDNRDPAGNPVSPYKIGP
ncbi:MAG: hypothetical protein M5U14_00835 [Acidimicrobiia bacterium]|nr:hypothetical protein [Acidimicrobiia bacterium]